MTFDKPLEKEVKIYDISQLHYIASYNQLSWWVATWKHYKIEFLIRIFVLTIERQSFRLDET